MSTIKTGRKPKKENEKIRQKKVYISDKEEKEVLKRHKKTDLTALVRHFNQD